MKGKDIRMEVNQTYPFEDQSESIRAYEAEDISNFEDKPNGGYQLKQVK